jgi:hypothetical protein
MDSGSKNLPDSAVEAANFYGSEAVGGALGMDTGAKKGFVGVDVAEAADELLIEQHRLDLAATSSQVLFQPGGREPTFKGLKAQALLERQHLIVLEMPNTTELALV